VSTGCALQLNQRLSEHCRKKAALCLLRIYRKLPEEAALITAESWSENFCHLLATAHGTGMHLAVVGLLLGVIERQGPAGYHRLLPHLVKNLSAVISGHGAFGDCLYYGIPSPWLQCKCDQPVLPWRAWQLAQFDAGAGAGTCARWR
jgi:hypothetical protein